MTGTRQSADPKRMPSVGPGLFRHDAKPGTKSSPFKTSPHDCRIEDDWDGTVRANISIWRDTASSPSSKPAPVLALVFR